MTIRMLHCKECGHTFTLPYSGIYDTHSCAEHEGHNYPHRDGCRACAADRKEGQA